MGPDGKPIQNPKQYGQKIDPQPQVPTHAPVDGKVIGPDDTEELDERNTDLATRKGSKDKGAGGKSANT